MRLERYLKQEIGCGNRIDVLGKLHSYTDKHGMRSEVNGWPSPETYLPSTLAAFIAQVREDEEIPASADSEASQ